MSYYYYQSNQSIRRKENKAEKLLNPTLHQFTNKDRRNSVIEP
ncbi:14422_t:CDS:2 [Funneliformis geosporum]|nr:14422_t:CDS:2 [Funneliformis geosporum]